VVLLSGVRALRAAPAPPRSPTWVARREARHSSAPVPLAELEQQATLAGTAAPLGLRELAAAVEHEREPGRSSR
jgi:hypothetical protein